MLEEPPLIARMCGSAGLMTFSVFIPQSERSQLRARRPEVGVQD